MSYNHPPQPQQRQQVELFISCQNLKNLDILSKSDPKCYFYTSDPSTGKFILQGKTETIKNNLNPKFTTTFRMDYIFEQEQRIQFVVMDDDSDNATSDDYLGSCQTTLGKIIGANTISGGKTPFRDDLLSKRGNIHGQILVHCTILNPATSGTVLNMTLRGKSLAKKDFGLFAKSDPYYIIQRQVSPNVWHDVFKSEVIMKNLNPVWKQCSIPVSKLCPNSMIDDQIKIAVWDWDQLTAHDLIGTVTTTVNQLEQAMKSNSGLRLVDNKGKSGGDLMVNSFHIEKQFTFVDYLQTGGCELSLMVAVDFTGSNGNPRDRNSLHFIHPPPTVANQPPILNEYQSAIWNIGNILAPYDSDQMFPCFGFGAKLPNGQISHCFPLNGNPQYPECRGVDGIMQAYQTSIYQNELWGPTNFATFINHVVDRYSEPALRNMNQELKYYILLILTDGEITDMNETIRAIKRAADTPLSIVIVGLGSADFGKMNVLDGDDGQLRCSRDIVQFVPYRQLANQGGPAALARETLREIPAQVEQFYRQRRVDPSVYLQRRAMRMPVATPPQQQQQQLPPTPYQPNQQQQHQLPPTPYQQQPPYGGGQPNLPPTPQQHGGYGAPPPQHQPQYGAPPPQQHYGGYGAPPPQPQYGGGYAPNLPPTPQQYGHGSYGAPPPQQ